MGQATTTGTSFHLAPGVRAVGRHRKGYRSLLTEGVSMRTLRALRWRTHRSGWPWVVASLSSQAGDQGDGLLLDDFVERTFHPARRPTSLSERLRGVPSRPPEWDRPWVGIFHHPPATPHWFQPGAEPRAVFATPRFRRSFPQLRGAIALSRYHADWLAEELGVPVAVVKHPTTFTARTFDVEAYLAGDRRRLVQVGWYLRNHRAIHQVPVPSGVDKVRLRPDLGPVANAEAATDRHSPTRHRKDIGDVRIQEWLDADAYDELLTSSVVFMELFDASANNAVIESIVRRTPLVVNRHPAVVEYLGADYPLFYDDLAEVPDLLDDERVVAAHEHLAALDTDDLRIGHFVREVEAFVQAVQQGTA